EKAKEEDREKLGEKEETIPPDYKLEEVKEFEDAKLSAAISEVVSQTPAPSTHAAAPPPDTE
ncbi:hypothetical protein A6R68_11966, partial [Neotoma lepida]